jgi:uncharacterized protein YbaA (DUF1428 family)
MTYVDGFLLVVPKKKLGAYKKMATLGKKIWMKHGALDYKECVGDDLSPKMGDMTVPATFPKIAGAKPADAVIFAYIVFKSKAHRDAVNKKVMKDPEMNDPNFDPKDMPVDMKKFSYGGFKTIVEA